MSKTKVVELKQMDSDLIVSSSVRFVLTHDGSVQIVGQNPNSVLMAEELTREGIPGARGMLYYWDGMEFLEALSKVIVGTRLWATEVFEMDEEEALKGFRQ